MIRWDDIALETAWIDYNGHLNMAAYLVIFDRAIDRLIEAVGLSATAGTDPTLFAASSKIDYRREIARGERLSCRTTVIGVYAKRVHTVQELLVGNDVRARCENLHVHVDRHGPKVVSFAADVTERLASMRENAPEWVGRPVAHRLG